MSLKNSFVTLCTCLMFAAACDAGLEAQPDGQGEVSLRPGGGGGVWLNTSVIGADELDLNKVLHSEMKLVSVKVKVGKKLKTLDQVWAVEGQMFGKIGSTTYSGAAFLEAEVRVRLYTQEYYNVEVPYTVSTYTAAPTGGLPRYTLKYYDGSSYKYVCGTDSVEAAAAVVLDGLTVDKTLGEIDSRADTLYFGCVSGAVGKAPTWGYKPWDLGLADFEAMVRMVRADYCGDGESWTTPGQAITIEDVWGVNTFAASAGATEGIWGPDGLLCLDTPRYASVDPATVICDGVPVPTCAVDASLASYPEALAWVKTVP